MRGVGRLTRIAVVIVARNRAKLLDGCLAALLESAKGVELIEPIAMVEHKAGESAGNPSRARDRQQGEVPPKHGGFDRLLTPCTAGQIAMGYGRAQDRFGALLRPSRRIISLAELR
jgi:hypothetical protein